MSPIMHASVEIKITRKQANRFISGMESNGFVTKRDGNSCYFTYNGEVDINHEIFFIPKEWEGYPMCFLKVRPTLGAGI